MKITLSILKVSHSKIVNQANEIHYSLEIRRIVPEFNSQKSKKLTYNLFRIVCVVEKINSRGWSMAQ